MTCFVFGPEFAIDGSPGLNKFKNTFVNPGEGLVSRVDERNLPHEIYHKIHTSRCKMTKQLMNDSIELYIDG